MDEKLRYRNETILKVLAWGTLILFLVWGYSLTESNSFELRPSDKETFKKLVEAKNSQANQLDGRANQLANEADKAAELRVQAAQIRLDTYLAEEQRKDNCFRAAGLILGALIYCILYPILVWGVYKRTDPRDGSADKDIFPLRHALIYAIVISLATFSTAFLTAWR